MIGLFFKQLLSRILTGLLTLSMGALSILGGVGTAEPEPVPEDFTPVLRFAAASDVHLNGEPDQPAALRLGPMFDDAYAYAQTQEYKGLDAVMLIGDVATSGDDSEYVLFNSIVREHKRPETQLLTVLGNHEFIKYRDYDATIGYEKYKQYVNQDVDTHDVINGFHFIGVSYDDNGKTFTGKLDWLKAELDKAVAEDPSKPVFVYEHPHPFGTVYGSVNWGDLDLRRALDKYPQVVDFSGHSHYASSDPRSVWQGTFTAVGTGSMAAYMGNLNYINGDEDAPGESAGFWIVEVDKDGRIRMALYDAVNHTFFDNVEYFIPEPANKKKRAYTWQAQKSRDAAPQFPDGAQVAAVKNENGETVLEFPDAVGFYEAENYKISVKAGLKTVWSDTVISDYVRAGLTGVSVNIGEIDAGEYSVTVTAYSPYAKRGGTIRGNVTVE